MRDVLFVSSPVLIFIVITIWFIYKSNKDRKVIEVKKQEIDKLKNEKAEYGDFEILNNAYRVYKNEYQAIDEIDILEIEFVIIDKKISTVYAKEKDQYNELSNFKISLIGVFISFFLTAGFIESFYNSIREAMTSDNVILYKVIIIVVFLALFIDITVFVMFVLMKVIYSTDKKDGKIREEYLDVLLFKDKLQEIRKIIIKNRIDELKRKNELRR